MAARAWVNGKRNQGHPTQASAGVKRGCAQRASEWSGVAPEDAFTIDDTNLFDKLGLQRFVDLSTTFYNRVYEDEEQWFWSIFAGSKKEGAIQNQYEFFV